MPRKVLAGLIQAATPLGDPAAPIAEIRESAIAVHIPLIEEAGRKGVQILGLQEVFNGPYFCPSQDPHWYDLAEPVPGPTTERPLVRMLLAPAAGSITPRSACSDGPRRHLTSRSLTDLAMRSNTGPYRSASPSGTIVAT